MTVGIPTPPCWDFQGGCFSFAFYATHLPQPLEKTQCLCNICHSPVSFSKMSLGGANSVFSLGIIFAFDFVVGFQACWHICGTYLFICFFLCKEYSLEYLCVLFPSPCLATKLINFILAGIILCLFCKYVHQKGHCTFSVNDESFQGFLPLFDKVS